MKKHAIKMVALAALVPSIAFADGDAGVNSQINESSAYSSGSNSTYQINNNGEARNRIGDVVCAAPSLDMGISGRSNNLDDTGMVYAAFNLPLGGSVCKDAQKAALIGMQDQMHRDRVEGRKMNLLFQNKMAQVCLKLHRVVEINPANPLWEECQSFTPK